MNSITTKKEHIRNKVFLSLALAITAIVLAVFASFFWFQKVTMADQVTKRLDSTVNPLPTNLIRRQQSPQGEGHASNSRTSLDGKSYQGGSMPLVNAANESVGQIVPQADVTEEKTVMPGMLLILSVTSILATGFLCGFFWFYLGRLQFQLSQSKNQLVIEIDDRKQTEDKLRKNEAFYRGLYEMSGDAIILIGLKNFIDCNRQTLKIFGFDSKEDFCKYNPADLSPPVQSDGSDSKTLFTQHVAQAFKSGSVCFEWTHMRQDGTLFPAEVVLNVIDTADGGTVLGVVRDITDRKQSEEQLRESELKLRAISDAALDAVIMMDSKGRAIYWNPAAENIFGYSRNEILGKDIHKVLAPPNLREKAAQHLVNFFQSGNGQSIGKTLEIQAMRKDSTEIPVEISISSVKVEGRWCAVAILRDISERKRAEQQQIRSACELKKANDKLIHLSRQAESATRAKSEFLANMSHEIRTPMTAILGYAELLMEMAKQEDEIIAATTIKNNGEFLLRILNDILDLSKIEAGKLEVVLQQSSPVDIISDVASLMQVRAVAKNISLDIEYDGAIPETILFDPLRFRQILINLTGNAIKFTEIGGVRIVTRLTHNQSGQSFLQVNIVDTGIGLTSEQMARLFQPFVQADATTSVQFGGTGLGLIISRKLAEAMGGDITITSSPGNGCTFRLTIETGSLEDVALIENPTENTSKAIPQPIAPTTNQVELNCRILLAEDGPDNQRLISFILQKAGAEVTIAENGKVALDTAMSELKKGTPFDAILMDMRMPLMDGYEATRQLRKQDYTGPIIALTANAMSSDKEKCLEAGCTDFSSKPVHREDLLKMVDKYTTEQASYAGQL